MSYHESWAGLQCFGLISVFVMLDVAVKDDRLRCVKELVYAEEVYNECLKSLFDLYAEPLR